MIKEKVLSKFFPKKTFILIGVNDLSADFPIKLCVDNYKKKYFRRHGDFKLEKYSSGETN